MSQTSSMVTVHELIDLIRPIANDVRDSRKAAEALNTRVKTSAGDVVTDLDINTQTLLRSQLRLVMPDAQFLGEEGEESGRAFEEGQSIWVVDPIDGTTNVVHGVEHAAISAALLQDGLPVLGVVHNIFSGETYFSAAGEGAFYRQSKDEPVTRLRVSTIPALSQALVSFGLPYCRRQSPRIFAAAERVFARSQNLRCQGSAALDLVGIAAGRFDAHFELDLRIWDIAAASLILNEAGGYLTDWHHNAVLMTDATERIPILASNGLVHVEMMHALVDPALQRVFEV